MRQPRWWRRAAAWTQAADGFAEHFGAVGKVGDEFGRTVETHHHAFVPAGTDHGVDRVPAAVEPHDLVGDRIDERRGRGVEMRAFRLGRMVRIADLEAQKGGRGHRAGAELDVDLVDDLYPDCRT